MALRNARFDANGEKDGLGAMLLRQAARIAVNRTVAGVHYPIDSRAGQVLGTCLAEYVVSRCAAPDGVKRECSPPRREFTSRSFDPKDCMGNDFLAPVRDDVSSTARGLEMGTDYAAPPSSTLSWLWDKAAKEWA